MWTKIFLGKIIFPDFTCKKIFKGMGILRIEKPWVYLPGYRILFRFDYCPFVWDSCSNLKEHLQKYYNKACRIINGDSYEILSSDTLQKLNWETLQKYQIEMLIILKAITVCYHYLSRKQMQWKRVSVVYWILTIKYVCK